MEDMAIRTTIDDHITPHGQWEGASIGTLVTIWLTHMLMERNHVLSHVREWVNDRTASINAPPCPTCSIPMVSCGIGL
jgi:hypothetical protein